MRETEKILTQCLNSSNLAPNTKISYEMWILDFFSFVSKPFRQICLSDILKWKSKLKQDNNSSSSIAVKLSAVIYFYNYCYDEKLIAENPTILLKKPRIKPGPPLPVLSRLEFFQLKLTPGMTLRDRAIIELLYDIGLRVSELINIKVSDYDKDLLIIRIVGKGNVERLVPITHVCNEWIKKYLSSRTDDYPFLFVSNRKREFTRQGIWKMIKKYVALSPIEKNVSPHTFRRTAATDLSEKGMEDRGIMTLLGIVKVNTLSRYIQRLKRQLKAIHDKYF